MVRRRHSVFFMVVEVREASDGRPSYHNGTGKQWEKCGKCGERKFPLNGKIQNRGNVPATAFAGENLLAFLARIGIMGGVGGTIPWLHSPSRKRKRISTKS